MDKTLSLYDELNAMGVNFYLWDIEESSAATVKVGNRYGIFMDFDKIHTKAEETVTVAHEGGHIAMGALHCLDSPYDLVEKHECKADKWAIKRLIPEDELNEAVSSGHTEIWDLAEYFNVTEDFMRKAVCWYSCGNLDTSLYFCSPTA